MWNFVKFCEILWNFMIYYENFVKFYEILWNFVEFHGILWNFVKSHIFCNSVEVQKIYAKFCYDGLDNLLKIHWISLTFVHVKKKRIKVGGILSTSLTKFQCIFYKKVIKIFQF